MKGRVVQEEILKVAREEAVEGRRVNVRHQRLFTDDH